MTINTGGQRFQEIKNLQGNNVLSKFDYTYNPVGTIATWQQQQDSNTPTVYNLTYDSVDQLTSAVQSNTSTNATVSSNAYNYDPAGNRLAETTLTSTTTGQFNNLNQLTNYGAVSGTQTVAGTTSRTVTSVNINGQTAAVTSGTNFSANVPLPDGTNTVSIVAKPGSGSPTTQRFGVTTSGTSNTALTYDADGNTLTDENGNSYQWDALSRLMQIIYPSGASSLFAYDGLSHRTSIIEKNNSGTVTSTKNYLWIGSEMVDERDASNNVTKQFYPQGEQQAGTNYYYTRDHLGSVREIVDGAGTFQARYSYDAYGKVTKITGTLDASFQYANYYFHLASGLNFTLYRAFDQNSGRWLSHDPLEEKGWLNLYEYVQNSPLAKRDILGLKECLPEVDLGPDWPMGETEESNPIATTPWQPAGPLGGFLAGLPEDPTFIPLEVRSVRYAVTETDTYWSNFGRLCRCEASSPWYWEYSQHTFTKTKTFTKNEKEYRVPAEQPGPEIDLKSASIEAL